MAKSGKHDTHQKFPNELGSALVSVKSMTISPISVEEEHIGDVVMKKGSRKKKSHASLARNADQKALDNIWRHMSLGHIDISYACAGYAMDGRPILNYDDFANLLVSYGFDLKDVVVFIDDFAKHEEDDHKSPIVMFTANASAIMTSIKPLDS